MWTPFFTAGRVRSWDDARKTDRGAWGGFFRGMLERGVLLPPSPFECAFVSAAHGDAEIDLTLEAARAAFREARS
jgi:glutamate-1-semialdehyde 2,1-aminomutase